MTGSRNEGRVLGIDYGSKRIGIAVSDPLRMLAHGVETLENSSTVAARISAYVARESVTLIVVGMPYAADGGKSRKALEVDDFIAALQAATTIPIDTWDESYSSVDARRAFIDGGMKKKKRQQKARVDVMAARLMLQGYLDHLLCRKQ